MVAVELGAFLPFFLVLALVYGSLEVSGTFKNRGVKAILSVVLAFFAITTPAIVEFITAVMPYAAFFFIAFFFLGFVLSFFKEGEKGKKDYTLIAVVLVLVLVFLASDKGLDIFTWDDSFLAMVVLLAIAMILYAAYKRGGHSGGSDR
ncbi:MAG: hypothetical protein HY369_02010 [Candidatus Aenigmarchaeota archaeon]|nr:hypothetical protein [Candidatus Aenigmarchaeota archaeon]